MPVAADAVEFCRVRMDESLSSFSEVIAFVHVNVDDTAVAQRYTTPRSVREFRSETDGSIRRRLDHEIGKAVEWRRHIVLQRKLSACRCCDVFELLSKDVRFLWHAMDHHTDERCPAFRDVIHRIPPVHPAAVKKF